MTCNFKDINLTCRGCPNSTMLLVSGKLLPTAHLFQVNKIDKFCMVFIFRGIFAIWFTIRVSLFTTTFCLRKTFKPFAKQVQKCNSVMYPVKHTETASAKIKIWGHYFRQRNNFRLCFLSQIPVNALILYNFSHITAQLARNFFLFHPQLLADCETLFSSVFYQPCKICLVSNEFTEL